MKVVISTTTAFHLRHLARELDALGHQVRFHSYLPKWKTRAYGLDDSMCRSHFWRLLPWSALALLRGGGARVHKVREALFARIDRLVANQLEAADVFIGLSGIAVESAKRARELGQLVLIERGATHILTQRDVAIANGMAPPSKLYVDRELAGYGLADKLVLLSQHSANTFIEHGHSPAEFEITPLGVDTALFKRPDTPPPLPVRAIYVGVWSRRKGADLLEPLLEAIPELELSFVGKQGDLPFPEHPRFKRLGYLPHKDLADALRQHHLFIFPSRDDGFGMVLSEAIASGLRVVASTASGAPDLARLVGTEHVALVAPGALDELIVATKRQIAAIEQQPDGFSLPDERIETLSWRGYGERYAAMAERLLGMHR